jgi:outer membrane receptor protein involved in Fe transport
MQARVSRAADLKSAIASPLTNSARLSVIGCCVTMLCAAAAHAKEGANAAAPTDAAPAAAAASAGPTAAVSTDATLDSTGPGGIQELVITATRRTTTVQDTPIAISAVGADTLTKSGVSSMQDIATLVPSMRVEGGRDGGGRITMRGIRPPAGESTVGLYYGETPMVGPSDTFQASGNFTQNVNLFDVERVEALRGPQGTLYGSSSMGGAMRVLFNKANTTRTEGILDASGSALQHGDAGFWLKGAYNIPLVQGVLAARVVLWKESHGGYVNDVYGARGATDQYHIVDVTRRDINSAENHGGRVMLTFTPTDTIKWTGMAMTQDSNAVSSAWYPRLGADMYNTTDGVVGEVADKLNLYSSDLEWTAGPVDLTWAASYYRWNRTAVSDYTPVLTRSRTRRDLCGRWWNGTNQGAPLPANSAGTVNCAPGSPELAAYTAYSDSETPAALLKPNWLENVINEVRIASNDKGRLQWILGAYLEKRKDHVDSMTGKVTSRDGRVPDLNAFPVFWHRDINDDVTQTAFFGDTVYKPQLSLLPGLALNYGIRRFKYQKKTTGTVYMNGWATGDYARPTGYASADAQGWLQKYNVSYEFTRPFMVYASAAKGFRPGGANQTPNLDASLVPYEPDSVWNYELGGKSSWLNKKLIIDAALYQIDWTNMQVTASTANRCCTFITNAGAAKIKGVELEVTMRPLSELEFNAGLSYNFKSELTEDQKNSRVADSAQLGLSGNRIPYVAKLNASASVQYSHPLSAQATGLLRLNYTYTGSSYTQFRPDYINNDRIGGFSQLNLRAGAEVSDWEAYLFVNNVFDAIGVYDVNSNRPYVNAKALTQAPREVGINLRRSF